ncbi:hypothetical protein BS50DRAFT_248625 [Corynespora cassiicola Philippines]|uniref:Cerato-platanin n=1 Tax=Corynespora cassiicola Philippines TaxID=1448308 RepID=A0A2T2P3Q3_CORCC|nr:hypothetical protein BS50DRAFT_248625 [Corynespora cassiicola Philippines]
MLSTIATTFAMASVAMSAGISITPHDKYSSSVGVLGCHIDTNRVAYWPSTPSCDGMCKKVSANGRSVTLLHVDTSGGAYDISYDAWNYLNVGKSATEEPTAGGGIPAEFEDVPMEECMDIIKTESKKLPLMAASSIGFYIGCAGKWVGENSALYNIQNQICTLGYNEVCTLDLNVSNQPSCPHMLGAQNPLSGIGVQNIDYQTGAVSAAV